MRVKKKFLWWGGLAAALYVLLSYHFIFFGRDVRILKKSQPTLEYTFFSVHGKKIPKILAIEQLRQDGIGDLLVEMGMLSEEQLEIYLEKYEHEQDYD